MPMAASANTAATKPVAFFISASPRCFAGRNFPAFLTPTLPKHGTYRNGPLMSHWLLKSEPDVFSWDQLVANGTKGEPWTGVRNHPAKLNLMKMKKGETFFFYHSNIGKEIVGIGEIIREHYPDPTADAGSPGSSPT